MFNTEWDNIVDSRDQLYAEIPEPKSRQTLNANHYFSSTEWRGILAGDTRVMNDLTQLFTEQRD